jgi:hypothetical protein
MEFSGKFFLCYYLVRSNKTGEVVGVMKNCDHSLGGFIIMASFEHITKSEYETYIEFGLKDIVTLYQAVSCAMHPERA